MPEVVFAILKALADNPCGLNYSVLLDISGYADSSAYYGLRSLRKLGLVDGRKNYVWWATERGKIAVALEVGRRRKIIAKDGRYDPRSTSRLDWMSREAA